MAALISFRLFPSRPSSGSEFTVALTGLTVTAFDLTVEGKPAGVQIGAAKGMTDAHPDSISDDSVNVSNTSILQH
jgi:hypothetical protein